MSEFRRKRRIGTRPGSLRAWPLTLGVLALFLASTLLGTMVSGASTVKSGSDLPFAPGPNVGAPDTMAVDSLTQAASSLSAGAGPATGSHLQCSAPSTSDSVTCNPSMPENPSATVSNGVAKSPESPPALYGASITYDAKDRYVVMFGGSQVCCDAELLGTTWTFAAGTWTNITHGPHPSPRYAASMAYDAKDGYVVLFGGMGGSYPYPFGDTWTFAGGKWTELNPLASPAARFEASMVYDAKDGYVMLFGGATFCCGDWMGDTWKFADGSWTLLTPSTAPTSGYNFFMTYDAKDGYVVLFGGSEFSVQRSETWKFVGGEWTELNEMTHPSTRDSGSMTYDARDGYVVLFGGGNVYPLGDTWKFAQGVWTNITSSSHPMAGWEQAVTYDARDGYVLLFGGQTNVAGTFNATWQFSKGSWNEIAPAASLAARYAASITYDAKDGYVLLFGGSTACCAQTPALNDTWKFYGGTWTELQPTTPPPARHAASMVYDPKDGYVVLFGGRQGSETGTLGDTWKFVGGQWAQLFPKDSPEPRSEASMTYDVKDGYVLLFGGADLCCWDWLGDTWSFAGGQWTELTPMNAPSPRYTASMAYDQRDGYVVLYGGSEYSLVRTDTWKFVGGSWTDITPKHSPLLLDAQLVYDVKDAYVLLIGCSCVTSSGYGNPIADSMATWKFIGGSWTNITPAVSPPLDIAESLAFDPQVSYVVFFGGIHNITTVLVVHATWKFVGGKWRELLA